MSVNNSSINWGKTLWLNLVRSLCAGVVWCVIAGLSGDADAAASMLLLSLIYFPILLPLGLLARVFPHSALFGLLNLTAAIMILPGDPLVFLINRFFPQAVPAGNYPFFHFALVTFVIE